MTRKRTLLYGPMIHHVSKETNRKYEKILRDMKLPIEGMEAYYERNMKKIEKELWKHYVHRFYVEAFYDSGKFEVEVISATPKRHRTYMDKIVLDLADRGAKPMKTESKTILEKSSMCSDELFEIVGKFLKMRKKDVTKESYKNLAKRAKKLLSTEKKLHKERNRYVARRIDMTLRPGETGVLLMGAGHSDIRFKRSINVVNLVDPEKVNMDSDSYLDLKKIMKRMPFVKDVFKDKGMLDKLDKMIEEEENKY